MISVILILNVFDAKMDVFSMLLENVISVGVIVGRTVMQVIQESAQDVALALIRWVEIA